MGGALNTCCGCTHYGHNTPNTTHQTNHTLIQPHTCTTYLYTCIDIGMILITWLPQHPPRRCVCHTTTHWNIPCGIPCLLLLLVVLVVVVVLLLLLVVQGCQCCCSFVKPGSHIVVLFREGGVVEGKNVCHARVVVIRKQPVSRVWWVMCVVGMGMQAPTCGRCVVVLCQVPSIQD